MSLSGTRTAGKRNCCVSDLGQHNSFGEAIATHADRRGEERYPIIRTAKLVCGDIEMPCVLRDISNSALRVRIYNPLPQDMEGVQIEFGDGDKHNVELIWQREGHAGLRFPDFADLRALVGEKGPFRKRAIRIAVEVPSALVLQGKKHDIVIEDISHQGARIQCDLPLAMEQQVRIAVPALGEVYAMVRWRSAPHYGLAFVETFRFEEIAHMAGNLQALTRVWRNARRKGKLVRPEPDRGSNLVANPQPRIVNG